jgi:hypothetical protein
MTHKESFNLSSPYFSLSSLTMLADTHLYLVAAGAGDSPKTMLFIFAFCTHVSLPGMFHPKTPAIEVSPTFLDPLRRGPLAIIESIKISLGYIFISLPVPNQKLCVC